MAAMGAIPEFTIENAAVETVDGIITYVAGNFQVSVAMGAMSVNYNATLEGTQAGADAVPVLKLVLQNATTDTVYFGADQASIDAYKAHEQEVAISNINATSTLKNGKYLENNKVVIIRNGVKYSVNGAVIK